jgi:hypothetical protein
LEDLKKVVAIARNEGCLFARKFVLWNPDDTTSQESKSDEVPPGRITVEEWKQCMDEFTAQQPEANNGDESNEPDESTNKTKAT